MVKLEMITTILFISILTSAIPEDIPSDATEVSDLHWSIREWNAPNDLPNEVVRDVIQTSDGSIWLATWGGGLVKLNGTSREVIDTEDGLISNDVRALEEDRNGRIWVGTNSGISCITPEGIHNFSSHIHPEIPANNSIFAIESLRNGEVWFGDGLGYLYSWKPSPNNPKDVEAGNWVRIYHFVETPKCNIRLIKVTDEQEIFVAVNDLGVVKMRWEENKGYNWIYYPYRFGPLSQTKGFVFLQDGRIISVGGDKCVEANRHSVVQSTSKPMDFKCIQTIWGKVFIGTEQGLYLWENRQPIFFPLTSDNRKLNIECLSALADGSLWVGTRSGVFSIREPAWSPQYPMNEIKLPIAESLAQDNKNQLFLLDNNSVVWTYRTKQWRPLSKLGIPYIAFSSVDIFAQNHRAVILVSPNLYELDLHSNNIVRKIRVPELFWPGIKNQMNLPNHHDIWIADESGIRKVDMENFIPALPLLHDNQAVYSILQTAPDEYWIGGKGWIEHRRGEQSDTVELPETILDPASPILDSMQTKDGELWFSQLGQGILRYRDNQWQHQTVKDGLPSNYIWTLYQARDGTIWAGDRINGVMSYRDNRWIHYKYEDGIPIGAVLSIVEDEECNIWIGVEKEGIFQYQPDRSPPAVEIVSAPQELVPDAQGVFAFRGYDAWKETPTEELVYSWRILEHPSSRIVSNWSTYSKETSALIPPLKPGHYRFEAQAQDKHRNTSPVLAQAVFQVNPYLWMDYRFQLPVILSAGLGLLLLQQWWKRYQLVLHSEWKYKSMVEQDTHTLILHWNSDWTLIYANECAQKTLGIKAADIHRLNVLEGLFSWDTKAREAFLQAHEQSTHNPESHQLHHFPSPGVHNEIRQISWLFRIVQKEPGAGQETHAFGIDITQQQKIEKELHRERITFQEFCEAAHIGVFRLSMNGDLLFANAAMAEILGFGGIDEMMNYPQPIPWLQDRRESSFVESILSQEGLQPTVWRGNQPTTGQEISVLLYGVVKGEELEIMTLDLTQQKRLEKEIVLASAREQQKIGRDLHDSVVQDLTGISFLGQSLLSQWQDSPAEGVENLQKLVENVDEVRQRIRKITKGLSPIHLGKLGFQSALQEIVQSVRSLYGIHCVCELDSQVAIPHPEDELNLYLIAHEALINAAKHSKARSISLRLSQDSHVVALTIQDNGIGMDSMANRGGMGMQIMQYRAEMIGAEIQITNKIGEGTRVECRYPRSISDP